MFDPNLQKEERYTLGDKWVGMTNHLGNAQRAEALGARSDASFLYMSKGRQLMAYFSRLDPILEGTPELRTHCCLLNKGQCDQRIVTITGFPLTPSARKATSA